MLQGSIHNHKASLQLQFAHQVARTNILSYTSDGRAFEPSPKARSLGRFFGKLGSLEARTTKLGRLDEPKEWQKNSTFWHFFAVFPI